MKTMIFAAVLGVSAFLPMESTAQSDLESAVTDQLLCKDPPSPLPILEALESQGKIKPEELDGFDSISCFPIAGGIVLHGLKFDTVCAHEEDNDIREQRPDLLYRGPGTSPGQHLSFGTDADAQTVANWYSEHVGSRHLEAAIDSEDTMLGDKTVVSCTSWFAH